MLNWVVCVLALWNCHAEAAAQVGYRETTWTYTTTSGAPREIRLALWYPSSGTPAPRMYAYIAGSVVENGPLPSYVPAVVVLSHGIWECGSSLAYIAQSLALSGYVIVAPDHEDAALCKIGGGTGPLMNAWPNRPADLRASLDLVASLGIERAVTLSAGHSLGGWTALAVDGSVSTENDPRVRGALLLSASANSGPAYYVGARAPLLYLYGGLEGSKSGPYLASQAPKYHDVVPLAGHYAFTDKTCGSSAVETCIVWNGFARRAVAMSRAFVAAAVGDVSALATLRSADWWTE